MSIGKINKTEISDPIAPLVREVPATHASERQRKAAKILFDKGFGYKLVSKILDLSPNTVRDWGREYRRGEFCVKLSSNQYRYSQEVKDCVRSLRAQGLSWKQISDKTGINRSTCRSWVRRANNPDGDVDPPI